MGAYGDDDGGEDSGSAYIFVRSDDGTWTQSTKLTADDAAVGDQFGWSVAISGDTTIVGAVSDDDEGNNSGSAYIFQAQPLCYADGAYFIEPAAGALCGDWARRYRRCQRVYLT